MRRVSPPQSIKLLTKRAEKSQRIQVPTAKSVVDRLVAFRNAHGLTYPDAFALFKRVGFSISPRTFENWAMQRHVPRTEALLGITLALDVLEGVVRVRPLRKSSAR